MKRSVYLYISDIFGAIEKIERYTNSKSYTAFSKDEMLIDAVIRNLEIMGEAVKNIPESFRKDHQEIQWKDIAGIRDIIIHGYFRVDLELIWRTVKESLPHLKKQLLHIKKDMKE